MDVVDIHPHSISPDIARYPLAPLGGRLSAWAATRPASAEVLIAQMDAAGIRRAALVHASTAYGYDNSYVCDVAAAHPERFVAVGGLDVLAHDAVATLRSWIRDRGMAGLRIFAGGSTMGADAGDWFDDPQVYPVWDAARHAGIPICAQVFFKQLPRVARMLERYPEVKVVVDHCARAPLASGPPYAEAQPLFDLARFPNAYVKLTEVVFAEVRAGAGSVRSLLERALEAFGPERIAWGSNFPASDATLADLLADAQRETAFLGPAARRAIFCETALTLYPGLRKRG